MSALHPDLAPPVAPVRPTFTYERRRPELTDLHAAIRIGWPQPRSVVHQALMWAISKHYQRDAELQKRGEVRDRDHGKYATETTGSRRQQPAGNKFPA